MGMRNTSRSVPGATLVKLAVLGALPAALACGGTTRLETRAPELAAGEEVDTVPALPPSYVTSPIHIDIGPLLRNLEEAAPRHFGDVNKKIKVNSVASVGVELWREPFQITFDSNVVTIRTVIEYAGKGWGPLGVKMGDCGINPPRPRARVTATSAIRLAPDWRLLTSSDVRVVPYSGVERDKCEVSAADIDVTGLAMKEGGRFANRMLDSLDRRVARAPIKAFIARYWNEIQKPIRIMDSTLWLQINPEAIGVARARVEDSVLVSGVTLLASPRIVSGARPAAGTRPLPQFARIAAGDTLFGLVEGKMKWSDANALLAKLIAKQKLRVGWRNIRLTGVETQYAGAGRVAIGVDLSGPAEGRLWFTAKPVLDTVKREISFPDLELDVNSRTALGSVAWLAKGTLRDYLRGKLVISSKDLISLAAEKANEELTRDLSKDVRLVGWLGDVKTLGVRATPEGLVARARAKGHIRLDITAPGLVKPKPKVATAPGSTSPRPPA